MELIVTSFLATFLVLFGHLGMVIAERLRSPERRVWRFSEISDEPPPMKWSKQPYVAAPRAALTP